MKKLIFMALVAIFACVQVNAQSILGTWNSQENYGTTAISYEFKTQNIYKRVFVDFSTDYVATLTAGYFYNPKTKILTLYEDGKKTVYKVNFVGKNKIILERENEKTKLGKAGTDEDPFKNAFRTN